MTSFLDYLHRTFIFAAHTKTEKHGIKRSQSSRNRRPSSFCRFPFCSRYHDYMDGQLGPFKNAQYKTVSTLNPPNIGFAIGFC